jgi:glutamate dehydrogenase (NAD(P)+)
MEARWQELCDDLGPAKIVLLREPAAGLQAVVVVDNLAAGPAIGGVRMAPDVTIEEVMRLARAMTLKNAAAGLPLGAARPASAPTRRWTGRPRSACCGPSPGRSPA